MSSPFALCLLCGGSPGRLAALCPGCEADLPWIASSCRTCGLPLPESASQLQCGECMVSASPFELAITPFHYRPPLSKFITAFKHHRQLIAGQLLANLLAREIHDYYLLCGGNRLDAHELMPELILPVPLHWTRWLWRGYNQAGLLGEHIGRALGISCRTDILKRIRRTQSQQALTRVERLRNLGGSFELIRPVAARRVALLDDVVTTGATATEIARLLRAHGVEQIHLWALARTPLSRKDQG